MRVFPLETVFVGSVAAMSISGRLQPEVKQKGNSALLADHHQQHLAALARMDRVRFIRRHEQNFAMGEAV